MASPKQAIPRLLKHVTIAIFYGGSLGATDRVNFKRAFLIAQSQLTRYGYLLGEGAYFELTSKGLKRERSFHTEGVKGWVKDRQFDWHYAWMTFKNKEALDQEAQRRAEEAKKKHEEKQMKRTEDEAAAAARASKPIPGLHVPGASRDEQIEMRRIENEARTKK